MGKKGKTGKARKDKFYYLAKETGYRSRAAFKLIQLNRRFNFLNTSKILVDLCAAPGGWLQVAAKEMPVESQILGVDLVPIQPIPRVKTFIADITTEKCRQLIRQELLHNKADVVLHDGAPNVGTAWSIDEFTQANLCLQAFSLATEVLRKGGWFITKVFRSRDYEPLKWTISHFFRTVRAIKPEASRMESAEIFLIGQFYLAPDRIDPRFLDSRHVFGEVETPLNRATIVNTFLKDFKKKKKALGYAEGDTLYHELPVSEFINSSDPLEALAKANKVTFDLPEIENHPLTTASLKADLDDLQVLGKGDIKNILKWHKKIKADLYPDADKTAEATVDSKTAGSQELPDDENKELKVEEEVQRLLDSENKELKKRLKRVRRAKIKAAERLVLKMDHPGDRIEQEDSELFSLATLHDLVALDQANVLIGDTSVTGSDALARQQQALASKALRTRRETELRTAIEGADRTRFERRAADDAERDVMMYDTSDFQSKRDDLYLSSDAESDAAIDSLHRGTRTRDPARAVSDSGTDSELDQPPPVVKRARTTTTTTEPKRSGLPKLDQFERLRQKRNPLLVDLDDATEQVVDQRKIRSWIESDEMKNLLGTSDEVEASDGLSSSDTDGAPEPDQLNKKKKKKAKRSVKEAVGANPAHGSAPSATNVPAGEQDLPPELRGLKKLRRPLTPEERALATRLIRSAKSRRDLIESCYHRMQFFEDPAELPDWFAEDERKHMRRPLPVEKEEIISERPTMGRSIHKVEEAKHRKKRRLAKRLNRVRQKAENISDDVPDTEKWQQIKQLYKKAGLLKKKRRPVHLIVNTRAGAKNPRAQAPKGAKIKIVDRRMKADLRSQPRGTGSKRGGRGKRPIRLMAHKPRRGGRK